MGKPWEDAPNWKTEMDYLSWLRSQIRRIWAKHPIRTSYIKQRPGITREEALMRLFNDDGTVGVTKISGNTKELKQCEHCEKFFPKGKMEVNHKIGGWGFTDYDGFIQWQHRMLFLGYDDIEHICKPCHLKITNMQKWNCTEDEFKAFELRAKFKKMNAAKQCAELKRLGLTPETNGSKRLEQYLKHLEGCFNLSFEGR